VFQPLNKLKLTAEFHFSAKSLSFPPQHKRRTSVATPTPQHKRRTAAGPNR